MIFQSLEMILPRFSTLKDPHNKIPRQKFKNPRQYFVAMNMMNKSAKFHKDSLSGKKVKFNLPSAIELLETADCANNFGGTLTNFSFGMLYEISQKMPLYFFYTMVQKSQKRSKTQIKGGGGPALISPSCLSMLLFRHHERVQREMGRHFSAVTSSTSATDSCTVANGFLP